MSFELFCLTRPHYPYECSDTELKHIGMNVLGLTVHKPVKNDTGLELVDLKFSPIQPVDYIYVPVKVKTPA